MKYSYFSVGDLYPGANILGIDLSPIQPDWVPPNVTFMVDDVESSWLKPRDYYDYIHARHIVMAIKDWPLLMQRAFEYVQEPFLFFSCFSAADIKQPPKIWWMDRASRDTSLSSVS